MTPAQAVALGLDLTYAQTVIQARNTAQLLSISFLTLTVSMEKTQQKMMKALM